MRSLAMTKRREEKDEKRADRFPYMCSDRFTHYIFRGRTGVSAFCGATGHRGLYLDRVRCFLQHGSFDGYVTRFRA